MIQSVHKAMQILSVIANAHNEPVTLGEIARQTGFPGPTCSHILDTLCTDGYAKRAPSRGYLLGPALYCLTRFGGYEADFVALCHPVMRWMERNSSATVILSVIEGDQKYNISTLDTEQKLFRRRIQIRTDDIYRTAAGRVLLAHLDDDEIYAIYQKYGPPLPDHWPEVTDYESLRVALAQIREQKIVPSLGKTWTGFPLYGYASPLMRSGRCVGAIGLAYRLDTVNAQIDAKTEASLQRILLRGIKEIERRLSYEE
ncbi:MAG: helix-turn-helix domain-containing protein [Clostridia bacterium]|nr:helix-turn-helix domain-containing protein [Clostridia bacterium]